MAELKFEVLFTAIDRLSGTIKKVGTAFSEMNEKTKATGEGLVKAGLGLAAVGAGGLVGLKYLIDPAIEAQGEMAHLATAMQDGALQAQHLAEVNEFVEKTGQNSVISLENLREAYYIARSQGLDHAKALEAVAAANDLVIGTTKNAEEANASMFETTRTLTGLANIYHENLNKVADSLSLLQTKYAFRNIDEINEALKYVAPVAKGAHVGITEMSAALAVLSSNMQTAGQGGTILRNVLLEFEKGGAKHRLVPFRKEDAAGNFEFQKSLESLLAYLQRLGPVAQAQFLADSGFQARTISGIQVLLANHQRLIDIQQDQEKSTGAAHANEQRRLAATDEQLARLGQSWDILRETIGGALVGPLTTLVQKITDLVVRTTAWAKLHTETIKHIAVFIAIASAAFVVLGVLATIAGSLLILGAFISSLGVGSVIFASMAAAAAILGSVAYGVYKNWEKVKTFFVGLGAWFKDALWPMFKTLGTDLLKQLGEGLLDGLHYLTAPLEAIGRFIIDHFKGHSPPPLGPLHELDRVNIIQTIARTITPTPLTAPLATTAGYLGNEIFMQRFIAPALLVYPPMPSIPATISSHPLAPSRPSGFYGDQPSVLAGGRTDRSIKINLDYHPTFNGATPEADPRQQAKVIMREIHSQLVRENTLRFDR